MPTKSVELKTSSLAKAGIIFGLVGLLGPIIMALVLYASFVDKPLPPANQIEFIEILVFILLFMFSMSAFVSIVLGIFTLIRIKNSVDVARDKIQAIVGIILGLLMIITLVICTYIACSIRVGSPRS